MQRSTVVVLGAAAFGLAFLSFFVLGTVRLVVGPRIGMLVAAPIGLLAAAIAVGLFVRGTLAVVGVWPIEESDDG